MESYQDKRNSVTRLWLVVAAITAVLLVMSEIAHELGRIANALEGLFR